MKKEHGPQRRAAADAGTVSLPPRRFVALLSYLCHVGSAQSRAAASDWRGAVVCYNRAIDARVRVSGDGAVPTSAVVSAIASADVAARSDALECDAALVPVLNGLA